MPLLVTFGLSIIIQNGLLLQFSADSRRLSLGALETASSTSAGITMGVVPLLTFGDRGAGVIALTLIFYRTSLGRILRATSDSPEIVQLMGVDPRKVFAIAMGISFVVLTLSAFFMGVRANFDPSAGPARLLYAFEAVVIGGLGSFWGTLAGGVILGVAQTIGATINPEWQQLAGHLVFLAVILVRPRGLFPRGMACMTTYTSATATRTSRGAALVLGARRCIVLAAARRLHAALADPGPAS